MTKLVDIIGGTKVSFKYRALDINFVRSVCSQHGCTDQTFFVFNISIQVSHTGLLYFWDICAAYVENCFAIYMDWQEFQIFLSIFCILQLLNRWTKFFKNINRYFLLVNKEKKILRPKWPRFYFQIFA